MKNTAIITGASSGLGEQFARLHAARGGDLVLVARRGDRLRSLADELGKKHGVECLVLVKDLSLQGSGEELFSEISSRGISSDVLINNAGFGGHGMFHEREWTADLAMINVNVMALCALTRGCLPGMIARGRGRVLNVASMAGYLPGPLQAVYYATKAFVVSFSQAVGNEVEGTGVTVTALCPGAVDTGFAQAGSLDGVKAFERADSAEYVARFGYDAMLKGKRVAVPGPLKRLSLGALRFMPAGMVLRVSRASMEKKK